MQEILCVLCGSNHQSIVYSSQQQEPLPEKDDYRITEDQLIAPDKIVKCINEMLFKFEKRTHFDFFLFLFPDKISKLIPSTEKN